MVKQRNSLIFLLCFILVGPVIFPCPAEAEKTDQFIPVAKNKILLLSRGAHDDRIMVKDLRNNRIWQSNPSVDPGELNEYWKRRLRSCFILKYWDEKEGEAKIIETEDASCQKKYQRIEEGLAISYWFQEIKIGFKVLYTLKEDCLEVRIPAGGILESPQGEKIISLMVLPFFGAGRRGSPGYLFFPDGSGAISHFNKKDAKSYSSFWVYGDLLSPEGDFYLTMPVYGVVKDSSAFLAVITAGECEAKIGVEITPMVQMHAVYPELVYREMFLDLFEKDRIRKKYDQVDRIICYIFLGGEEANYVGLAKAYGSYLRRERGVKAWREKGISSHSFNLSLFCGIKKGPSFFDWFITLTSFGQAKKILEQLKEQGLGRIDLTLIGWNQGGFKGLLPRQLPPEGKLGGTRKLRKLIKYGKDHQCRISLQISFLDSFENSPQYRRVDTAKDGMQMPRWVERWERKTYLLCPQVAYQRFACRDLSRMKELGIDGIILESLGAGLFSCYDKKHFLTRRQARDFWVKILDLARDKFELVGCRGANDYLIGQVDKVLSAPLESSGWWYEDEAVPFYQIAFHGLVEYFFSPLNLRLDPEYEFLKMIEYGGLPSAELTYKRPYELKKTPYKELFSSFYRDWMEKVTAEYEEVGKELSFLKDQFILDHRKLARQVYQTTYEDGTKILVNYGDEDYSVGKGVVRARSYLILKDPMSIQGKMNYVCGRYS